MCLANQGTYLADSATGEVALPFYYSPSLEEHQDQIAKEKIAETKKIPIHRFFGEVGGRENTEIFFWLFTTTLH